MLKTKSVGHVLLWSVAVVATPSMAGGSLYVDDPGVTAAGRCQLESWMRSFAGGGHEFTTVPACSTGPVEWSVTLTKLTSPIDRPWSPGVKWQLVDNDDGGFGMAVAVTALYDHARLQTTDAYLAPGWVLGQRKQWAINVNLGMTRERGETSKIVAGIGMQYDTTVKLVSLLAEHLWHDGHGGVTQGGVRLNLSDKSTIDLLAGRSHDEHTDHWLTLGLNLAF